MEQKLPRQKDPLQRLFLLDSMASYYAFTNVARARELLAEQQCILDQHDNPDFRLNYHLNKATVDNQLYQFEAAEREFTAAIELLEERGAAKQLAEAYIDYAGTCMNLEHQDEALEYLEKAARLLKNFPDERLMARIICREGYMHLHYGNYSKAIEFFLEAEKRMAIPHQQLKLKDQYFSTLIHSGLGKVYERNDDYEKSIHSYLKVVDICKAVGMRTRLSWHYLNVGNGYLALSDYKNAENYFLKAIDVADDQSQQARASAYANMGLCHLEKKEYEKALELFDLAERLYQEKSETDYYNFSNIASWRGRLYYELDDTKRAMKHYMRAFGYAQEIEDYKQLSSISKDIAALYAEMDDYKSAYDYQVMHSRLEEQYLEQIERRKQMELEIKYEAEKKKQEAELLQLQATRLQLKALRAQMNPHFMYNALNAIQHYITSNEISSAAKYLAKFAKLMRQSLDYSDLEIISLEKELEFLEDYLYINEKLRFEGRLRYSIEVDDEIEEDILGVPTMIVQPYVENAIEHGLRTKKDGFVRVQFELYNDDTILCIVEDNGIGREKARQLRMQDPQYQNHRSKGTNITEKRLQILHHAKDAEVFVNTIDLKDKRTGEANGTRVEIKIPIVEIQVK